MIITSAFHECAFPFKIKPVPVHYPSSQTETPAWPSPPPLQDSALALVNTLYLCISHIALFFKDLSLLLDHELPKGRGWALYICPQCPRHIPWQTVGNYLLASGKEPPVWQALCQTLSHVVCYQPLHCSLLCIGSQSCLLIT